MASTEQKPDVEATKPTAEHPPPPPPCATNCFAIDVVLRVLLFAATLVALVVMVTSKQTVPAFSPGGFRMPLIAKFNHSPALIYFVAAMSVACLYSILTTLASLGVIFRPAHASKFLLHFAISDLLMLGIVASATGAAGTVAYIGLRGNSHMGWIKVCPVYDKFCRHMGSSVIIALFASILLVFLTLLSIFSLHRRIPGKE